MDELFSIFITLGKYSYDNLSFAETFKAIRTFSAENGVSIQNPRTSRGNRIVFDLSVDGKVSVRDCDIQCLSNGFESITIFGGNESELRKAGLFDEKNIARFIPRLALFLFSEGEYQVGIVSTEDTFTSLSFEEFHPGYWTIFRSDMLPKFVSRLPYESVGEKDQVRVYRYEQLAEIASTPEQMGKDIRKVVEHKQEVSDRAMTLWSEYGQLTDAEFFGALKAMDEVDEIKLTAHLENGQLVFDKSAPLPVEGNVIKIGVKRIVVELVQRT